MTYARNDLAALVAFLAAALLVSACSRPQQTQTPQPTPGVGAGTPLPASQQPAAPSGETGDVLPGADTGTGSPPEAPVVSVGGGSEADRSATINGGSGKINGGRDTAEDAGGAAGDAGGTGQGAAPPGDGGQTPPPPPDATRQCKTEPVTEAQIQQWVQADQGKRNNASVRYVAIPLDALNDADKTKADRARIALVKAFNATSVRNTTIETCEDVSDGRGAVYACDITKFWQNDAEKNWRAVSTARGRSPFSPAPALRARALGGAAHGPFPADQVVYNMVSGNIYNELINMARSEDQQRRQDNVQPQLVAWMCANNAIVFGHRYSSLWQTADGRKYWTTSDNFGRSADTCPPNANVSPPRNTWRTNAWQTQASEAWMEMPNGLIKFFIWGNASQERSKAEQIFVIDPANTQGRDLINGRSCLTCHINAVQSAKNARSGGQWTPNETLDTLYGETRAKWEKAMRTIVEGISCGTKEWNEETIYGKGMEPIAYMVDRLETGGRGGQGQQGGGQGQQGGGQRGGGGNFGGGFGSSR